MEFASLGLAFAAGLVAILSPCVLPLLPVVFGTALAEHRLGPVALATGLAISFLTLGLFVATIGFSIGLDSELFRKVGAALLLAVGVVLTMPSLQSRISLAVSPLGNLASLHEGPRAGLGGQFVVGLLLGTVWAPCAGPTLGAASMLAAQGRSLGQVAMTMLAFAIGAAVPLLALGFASRESLLRWRGRMLSTGTTGKLVLGLVLIGTAALILSGLDKSVETALVRAMPSWMNELSGAF